MKTPQLYLLVLASLMASIVAAQPIILDDDQFRLTQKSTMDRSSELGSDNSILGKDSIVLHQGENSGCGGYAIAHCIGIWLRNACNSLTKSNNPMPIFSGLYLCCKTDFTLPRGGYSMTKLLEALKKYGLPLATQYENNPYGCPDQITPDIDKQAAIYRIWDYARIFDLLADKCPNPKDTACIKRHEKEVYENTVGAIDKGQPVIIVMALPPDFNKLDSSSCLIRKGPSPNPEYHALVVTGYDDQKKVFQVINSYGKKWGCNGLAYIHYDVFGKLVRYGFVVDLNLKYGQRLPCKP